MDNNNNEEVKEFTQTVHVQPSTGKQDEEDDEEEEDEPENETPTPSSGEDKIEPDNDDSDEDDSEEGADTSVKKEPKPVDGETPRERALRLELTNVRKKLRDERRDELFVKNPTAKPLEVDLSEYDPEEVERFKKLVDKLGYAKKDDLVSETIHERLNETFNEFMEAHPEYAPENDKDGLLWNQYRSEFALYSPTQDPKILKKIMSKVHNDVYGVQPAKNLSKINASQEKIKVASHKGASAGKETRTKPQNTSGLRLDALKGFSDEEIAELSS